MASLFKSSSCESTLKEALCQRDKDSAGCPCQGLSAQREKHLHWQPLLSPGVLSSLKDLQTTAQVAQTTSDNVLQVYVQQLEKEVIWLAVSTALSATCLEPALPVCYPVMLSL